MRALNTSSRTSRIPLPGSTAPAPVHSTPEIPRTQPNASPHPARSPHTPEPFETPLSYPPTDSAPAKSCAPGFAAPCVSNPGKPSDKFPPPANIPPSCPIATPLRHRSPKPQAHHTSYKSAADGRRRLRPESSHSRSAQSPPAHCARPFHVASQSDLFHSSPKPHAQSAPHVRAPPMREYEMSNLPEEPAPSQVLPRAA